MTTNNRKSEMLGEPTGPANYDPAALPPSEPSPRIEDGLDSAIANLDQIAARQQTGIDAIYAHATKLGRVKKQCQVHKNLFSGIDDRESYTQSREEGKIVIVHERCKGCEQLRKERNRNVWLIRAGVPDILATASWTTWRSRGMDEAKLMADCQEYVPKKSGFLVLSGPNFGNGKSFAAVCIMRACRTGIFRSQVELLGKIRAGYGNGNAQKIVESYKAASILIVDDVGTGGGYRDELPIMHEILDHRHGRKMKTVLTTNLDRHGLADAIGERMSDRFRASAHLLEFKGPTRRNEARSEYFGD